MMITVTVCPGIELQDSDIIHLLFLSLGSRGERKGEVD